MKTSHNHQRDTVDQKEHIDWNIWLYGFNDDQQDVSGGQFSALKEDGENVVPVQQDSGQHFQFNCWLNYYQPDSVF